MATLNLSNHIGIRNLIHLFLQYWDLNGTSITASDGYLMSVLLNTTLTITFIYENVAKL